MGYICTENEKHPTKEELKKKGESEKEKEWKKEGDDDGEEEKEKESPGAAGFQIAPNLGKPLSRSTDRPTARLLKTTIKMVQIQTHIRRTAS